MEFTVNQIAELLGGSVEGDGTQPVNTFSKIQEAGKEVLIRWHSMEEDDDMLEAGEEYADMTELTFEYLTFE